MQNKIAIAEGTSGVVYGGVGSGRSFSGSCPTAVERRRGLLVGGCIDRTVLPERGRVCPLHRRAGRRSAVRSGVREERHHAHPVPPCRAYLSRERRRRRACPVGVACRVRPLFMESQKKVNRTYVLSTIYCTVQSVGTGEDTTLSGFHHLRFSHANS